MRRNLAVWLLVVGLGALWGCCSTPPSRGPRDVPASREVPQSPQPAPLADETCEVTPSPSVNVSGNAISLERIGPPQVTVGQEFEYQFKVTNITGAVLEDVVLTDETPTMFKLLGSEPRGEAGEGGEIRFLIGRLAPGESRFIRVRGSATETGCLETCASIDFRQIFCMSTKVVQPALAVCKVMPAALLQCEPIPVHIEVSNPGDGPATNVRVTDTVPEGWVVDGKSATFEIPVLQAGETRAFDFVARSPRAGQFTNSVLAIAEGGLRAEASASIVLRAPVLQVTKTGRETQYIHRPVTYEITVTNTGDGEARDTVLEDVLDGHADIHPGSGMDVSGNRIFWSLGTLGPGESRKVSFEICSDVEGCIRDTVTAKAFCAATVTATAQTMYEGIAALLLEVIDLDDPVEMGCPTTYVITVTNQGSVPDTNIRLVVDLEKEAQFVSADGATRGEHNAGKIVFAPLASLAPKAQAQWRLIVKAIGEGDTRFKAVLETDQLTRPVQETESTNMYR